MHIGGDANRHCTFASNNNMPYNQYPMLTFGLSQSAMISKKPAERKPISAQAVLSQP